MISAHTVKSRFQMKILFICTHNRCRSILAEAITNYIGQPQIKAASAGSSPQGEVHPLSLQYLSAHEIPAEDLKSQSWHDFENYHPDAAITLCDSAANETCPVWFGDVVQVHWGLDDPSKLAGNNASNKNQAAAFNNTIDILQRRVQRLLENVDALAQERTNNEVYSMQLKAILNQIAIDIN